MEKLDAMQKKIINIDRRIRRIEKETTGSSLTRPERPPREDL